MAVTSELLACARSRLAGGSKFDVHLPYGPMDWTVLVLHAFWDSWIHERDVLLARGAEHPTSDDASQHPNRPVAPRRLLHHTRRPEPRLRNPRTAFAHQEQDTYVA
jgi:hypothetical protein